MFPKLDFERLLSLSQNKILDCSNLKGFANHNFEFGENGRSFSKRVEKLVLLKYAMENLYAMDTPWEFLHATAV